jgi:hypothetical protein
MGTRVSLTDPPTQVVEAYFDVPDALRNESLFRALVSRTGEFVARLAARFRADRDLTDYAYLTGMVQRHRRDPDLVRVQFVFMDPYPNEIQGFGLAVSTTLILAAAAVIIVGVPLTIMAFRIRPGHIPLVAASFGVVILGVVAFLILTRGD